MKLAHLMREFQMNGIKSSRAMPASMRDHFLRLARSEAVPPKIVEQMRELVRAGIAQQDQQRLRDKG